MLFRSREGPTEACSRSRSVKPGVFRPPGVACSEAISSRRLPPAETTAHRHQRLRKTVLPLLIHVPLGLGDNVEPLWEEDEEMVLAERDGRPQRERLLDVGW